VIASTLNPRATAQVTKNIASGQGLVRIGDGVFEYAALKKPLIDVEGKRSASCGILRSFEGGRQRIAALRREMVFTWLCARDRRPGTHFSAGAPHRRAGQTARSRGRRGGAPELRLSPRRQQRR